jgi:hypothetical protein
VCKAAGKLRGGYSQPRCDAGSLSVRGRGRVAALERILEQEGLVAAAAAGKGPTAEEHLVKPSGLGELMAGLELSPRYG